MDERIPKASPNAADAADRLRLIACDVRLIDMALTNTYNNGFELTEDEREAVTMHLRRMISDAESLSDDILTRDREGRAS